MAALRGRSARGYDEPKPKNDAFTAMLLIALLAQLVAGIFLVLDYMKYPSEKPATLPRPPALASTQPQPNPPQNPPQ
jgi:hypothetical protein